jgi:GMP reductase
VIYEPLSKEFLLNRGYCCYNNCKNCPYKNMAKILETKSIYYNDVNLIAQPSAVNTRSEIPKELSRIIVSPMEAVVGETFAKEADRLGLTICLHRFCDVEKQIEIYKQLNNKENVFVSVGANDIQRVKRLAMDGISNFLVDIANGYLPNLKAVMFDIRENANVKKIMVGNVMTKDGYWNALTLNNDTFVRVGIAGGSACSTSDATGYNRGQITEIMEVKETRDKMTENGYSNYIIADGGVKNGNYAAKAFGAGADYVMMGGYFARALEAETHIIGDGTYWGGASTKQQERYGGIKKHSEGKVYKVEDKLQPLSKLVDDLWGGLSSAVSYSGYKTLSEFVGNGVFEIKENSLPPSNR